MKKVLIILLVVIYCPLFGQSFEKSALFTTTEIDDFKNTFGFNLGYNLKKHNNNQFSFHLSYAIKNAYYDDIKISKETYGSLYPEYYFNKISSLNQRVGAHFSYKRYLKDNDNSSFALGSSLSYYYFYYNKNTETTYYQPYPINFIKQYASESKYDKTNRVGLSLFAEFEIKSIVIDRLSLFSKINAEIITYGPFEHKMGGFNEPWITKWLTTSLGVRYDIGK